MSWLEKARTPRATGRPLKEGQRSWHEEVADRLAVREDKIATGTYTPKEHPCTALTTGTYGPKRPCGNAAIRGGNVCAAHGARSKHIRKAANRRILEELDPTLTAMVKIRDQEEHWPAAQRAAEWLAKQALGDPKKLGSGGTSHTVTIGLAIGGLPPKKIDSGIVVNALPPAKDE